MNILVTGANGFIGKNLILKLEESGYLNILKFVRGDSFSKLEKFIKKADFIIHLAGANRPLDESEFNEINVDLTKHICDLLIKTKNKAPLIFSSSTQAEQENPYGKSKKEAEKEIEKLALENNNPVYIFRLPNIFGKWCKPNYNSFIATFCHNICNDLPIKITNPDAVISLMHIDDLCREFINLISHKKGIESKSNFIKVDKIYNKTVGEIANLLYSFKNSRDTGVIDNVGVGFDRLLYSTYLSYFPPSQFSYKIKKNEDERGIFAEMLKTKSSGQFSFFTAHPGITRGGHYHHLKNEKFLVLQGEAKFCFRSLSSGEISEKFTSDKELEIVETVPGWTHDITNIGEKEMIVMLWANEIFDPQNPDTIQSKVIL